MNIPTQPKKSNKKIGIVIAAIIAIIVVISLVFFIFMGDDSEKFYGEWNIDSTNAMGFENDIFDSTITFNSDKTFDLVNGSYSWSGTWKLKDDKLYITNDDPNVAEESNINFENPFGWEYTISGDSLQLSAGMLGFNIVFNLSRA